MGERARRSAGLTQRQLSERSGIPQPTIARIESGKQMPRADTLDRLLPACGWELELTLRRGQGEDLGLIRSWMALTPRSAPSGVRRTAGSPRSLGGPAGPHGERRDGPGGRSGSTHWAALVRGYSFTFDTDAGALDVLATPSGTSGLTDLRARARAVPLRDLEVLVVDIADLMRMKRASGRVKDRMHLEVLSAMRDAAPDADEPRKT